MDDDAARAAGDTALSTQQAAALLIGPPFFLVLSGHDVSDIDTKALADHFMHVLGSP
ncbi:hypothetical protein [Streptomyces sclerotialus]|uniref:hypothetical protein n=1 Tax=Streptomyces sclerotialus TaxID=1957 RepID=UPI000A9F75F9